MSCVVAVRDHKRNVLVIGSDAQASGECRKHYAGPKVFENEQFIIGATGSVRIANVLEHVWCPPGITPASIDPRDIIRAVVRDVIPSLKTCLTEAGIAVGDEIGENGQGWGLLLGWRTNILHVDQDLDVVSFKDSYAACGCGASYALGALYEMHENGEYLEAVERVERALRAAAAFDMHVSDEFHYVVQSID